jgi:peptidoglycan hydrolase-like protein with peptidoglycan-binding domain
MFLASKTGWAGIAFTLLTTGMLVQGFPRSAAGSDSNKEGVAALHQNEIKKMQETLRNKGHYRGEVDGVFGLRTRASIRAYQKAENLPPTGQLDTRTAGKLGVSPESIGGGFNGAGPEAGERSRQAGHETEKGKPSAYINRAKGSERTSKTLRKAVKTVAAPESGRGDREKTLQAENDNHPQ